MGRPAYRSGGAGAKLACGGSGGLVAVGRDGELALPFNCSDMYRGYVKHDRIVYTAIYDEAYRAA